MFAKMGFKIKCLLFLILSYYLIILFLKTYTYILHIRFYSNFYKVSSNQLLQVNGVRLDDRNFFLNINPLTIVVSVHIILVTFLKVLLCQTSTNKKLTIVFFKVEKYFKVRFLLNF